MMLIALIITLALLLLATIWLALIYTSDDMGCCQCAAKNALIQTLYTRIDNLTEQSDEQQAELANLKLAIRKSPTVRIERPKL